MDNLYKSQIKSAIIFVAIQKYLLDRLICVELYTTKPHNNLLIHFIEVQCNICHVFAIFFFFN